MSAQEIMVCDMDETQLRKKFPIEVLRAFTLWRKYQEDKRGGKKCTPTAYNLQEVSSRVYSAAAISKWLIAAYNRGLIYQDGWYLDYPTFALTMEGKELFTAVNKVGGFK